MTRQTPDAPGVSASPTPYDDLNALLMQFVGQARELLGDNFVAAYLQGSFALGDFDAHSDVDWLIVAHRDLTDREEAELQAMHADLHALANPWATRLEGSYFPAAVLRRWSLTPRDPPGRPPRPADWADPAISGRGRRVYPLLFKGNGEAGLVRSEHDNSQVVRWVTRQKGIALAGPPARTLIEPVSAGALRDEILPVLRELAGWRETPERLDARWMQAFFVLLCCRMLHTLETGTVTSKKASAAWARGVLEPRWHSLITAAEAVRVAPLAERLSLPDPAAAAETLALLDLAVERSQVTPAAGSREIIARTLAHKSQAAHGPRGVQPGSGLTHGGGRRGQYSPPPMRPGGRGRRG